MPVPIPTLHLFPILDKKLVELLRSLSPDDWQKPTRAKQWTVKDIASHLLDGNLRTLSISRDKFFGESPGNINSYQDLVYFLNQLNADWVKATRRLSPTVLIHLLETTGTLYHEHLSSLDPMADAIFSVAWAGEERSLNWFHIAREYTEKWHHQQQIRETVGQDGITTRALYYPVLDTFLQALPHHYRSTSASDGATITIVITGEAGGAWSIVYHDYQWKFTTRPSSPSCTITLKDEDAWKLFTKGLTLAEAQACIQLQGDRSLGEPIFTMLSVMA
ncbi:MAG TPA: maleylpyruvate isomerase family mycothiol-dependent enzyme [Ohtaekwangia sp.]|uniref:maleylpyruvate isomerase family mycothiol-dependent enzyme n=1 Tax=Ohtaekwangia sp. TaxID=2066019 RepID=UPI002F93D869